MSKNFSPNRSKIRTYDISSISREFIGAIGKGYTIRTPTNQENFYTMSDSPNEILVSVEAMRPSLTFPLDPFPVSYRNSSGLTSIQLSPNSWMCLLGFAKYVRQIYL